MINILWSILNVALALSLLYIFFRAALLLKQNIGWGAALFFVFGLSSIGCSRSSLQNKTTTNKNLLSGIPENAPLGNASAIKQIALGYNKLFLLAEYHHENGIIKPRGFYVTVSGLVLGHSWEPVADILAQDGQQLRYSVVIQHKWLLLGNQVYSTSKQFEGKMSSLKEQL